MTTLIYIGLAVFVIISIAGFIYYFWCPKRKRDASLEYMIALNHLISGDKDSALKKLRAAVIRDSNNVDAYIKIGDIFREQGDQTRAVKIHRGLTVRSNLTLKQKIDLFESLIKDYESSRKFDRALKVADELVELTRNEIWAQKTRLRLYEKAGKWGEAIDAKKALQKVKGEKDNCVLALYKVEAGKKFVKNGKEKDGRVKFRQAIKQDKKCPPAYLYLSDSYFRTKRYKDALTELKRFMTVQPDLAFLAFDRIRDILFHIGSFGEIETIFNTLLEQNPENEPIKLALADVYERKGEIEKAIDLCYETLEKNSKSQNARFYLAKFLSRINKKDEALKIALTLLKDSCSKRDNDFTCKKCGYKSNVPLWRCPDCYEWNTFVI